MPKYLFIKDNKVIDIFTTKSYEELDRLGTTPYKEVAHKIKELRLKDKTIQVANLMQID